MKHRPEQSSRSAATAADRPTEAVRSTDRITPFSTKQAARSKLRRTTESQFFAPVVAFAGIVVGLLGQGPAYVSSAIQTATHVGDVLGKSGAGLNRQLHTWAEHGDGSRAFDESSSEVLASSAQTILDPATLRASLGTGGGLALGATLGAGALYANGETLRKSPPGSVARVGVMYDRSGGNISIVNPPGNNPRAIYRLTVHLNLTGAGEKQQIIPVDFSNVEIPVGRRPTLLELPENIKEELEGRTVSVSGIEYTYEGETMPYVDGIVGPEENGVRVNGDRASSLLASKRQENSVRPKSLDYNAAHGGQYL